MNQASKRKIMARVLMGIPGYKGEEYDAELGILTIHIGAIIYETCGGGALRWTWRARHEKSEAWTDGKKRFAVLAGGSGWFKNRGSAERAMRQFIEAAYL